MPHRDKTGPEWTLVYTKNQMLRFIDCPKRKDPYSSARTWLLGDSPGATHLGQQDTHEHLHLVYNGSVPHGTFWSCANSERSTRQRSTSAAGRWLTSSSSCAELSVSVFVTMNPDRYGCAPSTCVSRETRRTRKHTTHTTRVLCFAFPSSTG